MISQAWDDEIIELRNRATRSPGCFRPPASKLNKSTYSLAARVDRQVSARVYPNGEFGVGFIPPRGMSANDRRYEADRRYAEENAEIHADIEVDESLPEGFKYTRTKVLPVPPNLGIGAKLSQPRGKYGSKGITGYGRKMVRNGGTVIQNSCKGRYNRYMVMGTVTVPSYSPQSMKNINSNWGNIVRVFFQRIKRIYARKRYGFNYVSVTEIQPIRYDVRGEIGLHLHFLFVAIRLGKGKWVLGDNQVRDIWQKSVENFLAEGDKPQSPNYRRDMVSKSCAGYLAKYLSKGAEQVKEVIEEHGEEVLPSQWWSMDSRTRKCIHNHTVSSQGTYADMLLCICTQDMKEYYRYKRVVTIPTNPTEYATAHNCPSELVLGYGGLLTPSGCVLFQPPDMHRSIREYLGRTLDTSSPS